MDSGVSQRLPLNRRQTTAPVGGEGRRSINSGIPMSAAHLTMADATSRGSVSTSGAAPLAVVLVVDTAVQTQVGCVPAAGAKANQILHVKDRTYHLWVTGLMVCHLSLPNLSELISHRLGEWQGETRRQATRRLRACEVMQLWRS